MTVNVGSTDRIIRLVLGVVLILAPFVSGLTLFANPVWTWVAVGIGAVLVVVALLRFCPLYVLLGISTADKAPR